MGKTKVNVDFWSVVDSNGDPMDAHVLLQPLKSMPASKRLRQRSSEHSDYLEIKDVKSGQTFGFVSRVRMSGLPGRFNVKTAKHQALGISEEEGLDEAAYFLYDSEKQALCTQRHRLIRASTIEDIITELTATPIGMNPILRKDMWERFNKLERLGSLTVRFRGPAHHPDFSGVMPSMDKLLTDAQQQMNAETFELTMGVGRSRTATLNAPLLRNLMKRIRAKDENIDSLKVKGVEDGKTRQEEIDFIKDRLVFSSDAEYEGRALEAETCHRILRKAMIEHGAYLKSLL